MEITEDGKEKDLSDFFNGGFSDFLDNAGVNNCATVNKEDKLKNIQKNNKFEDLGNNFHSKTELNKTNVNQKIDKKEDNNFQFILISKKKQRPNDETKKKKKNQESISIKNKTEIDDYKSKKKKNKETFDNIYNYYNNNNDDFSSAFDVPQTSDGLLNTMNDFDFDVNQKKAAYTSQLNDEVSKPLEMFISSEVKK